MRKLITGILVAAMIVAGGSYRGEVVEAAQALSQQVLQLLTRTNTWTGLQTFHQSVGLKLGRAAAALADSTDKFENRGGVLYWNGSLVTTAAAGAGTVTSVAMTVPSILAVAGSPITASGTLAVTLATQADNTVFAGPSTGGPLAPTFRALADADIPDSITVNKVDGVTWASIDKTGSDLADLATRLLSDLTGTLLLANLTDGATAGVPLVAGGAGGDPSYTALDLTSATSISGQLAAANFPALTGDVTTAGGALATTLANSGVSAATYGSATQIPQIAVDAKGRITSASDVALGTNDLLDGATNQDTAATTVLRGMLPYGNATPAWAGLAVGTAGQFLRTDGIDVAWGVDGSALTTLNGTNIASGLVALSVGGSNKNMTPVAGGIVWTDADSMEVSAAGTVGQCFTSNGAAAPTWGACATLAAHNLLSATHGDTAAAGVTRGSVMIGNVTPAWSELVIGAVGAFLRSDGTDVSWSTDGSALTALNASALASGTVPLARISALTDTQIATGADIAASKLAITTGSNFDAFYQGSTTWDPASVADQAEQATTFTITGVAVGDSCFAGHTTVTGDLLITANVSAADTVKVVLGNLTGGAIDPASGTLTVFCIGF